MTLGEIYDAMQTLADWEQQRTKAREKLKSPERLGAMDLARLKQHERYLTQIIANLRGFKAWGGLSANQCDGCRAGAPLRDGMHLDERGVGYMTCQKDKYL